MARETPITTVGTLVRTGGPGQLIARLPNGKEVVAFPSREMREIAGSLTPGVAVVLELTPFDFSKARIVATATAPGAPG